MSTPPAPGSARLPVPRIVVVLAVIALALFILDGIHTYASVVAPLFLTVNLFIAAWPVRDWLVRRGSSPLVGTIVLSLIVFLVLSLFFFSLGWGVTSLVRELPQYQGKFETLYQQSLDLLEQFGITADLITTQVKDLNISSFSGAAQMLLGEVSGFLSLMAVLVVMMFMMAMDSISFPKRGDLLGRHQPLVSVAISDFAKGVRRYWVVTSVFGLIVAVLDVAVLLFLGVPLAIVWGIVSFLTNYIPNVGFIIGIIPPVLMALLAKDAQTALIVAALYSVINFIVQSIIQPKFNGDAVGITATVSFLSLMLWGSVMGGLGALLALPATLLAKAMFIDHDPQLRWVNAFIASDPDTSDPADAGEPMELAPVPQLRAQLRGATAVRKRASGLRPGRRQR